METALLVEPRKERKKLLADLLKKEGLRVETFETMEEAVEQAKRASTDLFFVDLKIPTQSGLEALEQLKRLDLPVILLTVSETIALKHDLYSVGDVVPAPVPDKALLARVRGILQRHTQKHSRRGRVPAVVHPVSSHVLGELHDPETGRLDAGRMASFLGTPLSRFSKFCQVTTAALHKSPASVSVQPHLLPIARSLTILTQLLGSKANVLAWLNSPHPDLGSEPPLRLILEGKAEVVADLLEAALAGQPS
jgi:DNA-binding response OmpR family regulator